MTFYSKKKLCSVRDHALSGEPAATCNLCYDLAIRQALQQKVAEQRIEHQKYLARVYPQREAA